MLDRQALISEVSSIVSEKITSLQASLDELSNSLTGSTKSSAGDKHETSRAMLHLEQEKLGKRLASVLQMKQGLAKINLPKNNIDISFGHIVKTNLGIYFIAIPLGKITFQEEIITCISPITPFAKALIGLKIGDSLNFNNTKQQILEIH